MSTSQPRNLLYGHLYVANLFPVHFPPLNFPTKKILLEYFVSNLGLFISHISPSKIQSSWRQWKITFMTIVITYISLLLHFLMCYGSNVFLSSLSYSLFPSKWRTKSSERISLLGCGVMSPCLLPRFSASQSRGTQQIRLMLVTQMSFLGLWHNKTICCKY
jgi:hypothetical protein